MTVSEAPAEPSSDASGASSRKSTNGAEASADSREAGAQSPGGPALRHEPALDGLRGLAVLAVVLFHLDRIDGGFLGVDLFFALSGFLITSLLLVERERRGRVALGRFWARRARRLFPALVLMMAGVAVLLLLYTPGDERPEFRGDVLSTWFYVANWHSLLGESSYWDMFTQPSPLDHAWSLAIEEQFYVVWPLVFVGAAALGRRVRGGTGPVVAVVAGVGAVVSFGLLAWTYEPFDTNRAYFGTDTRLGPTLLGVLLAVFCVRRTRREAPPHPALDVGALVALIGLCWAMVAMNGIDAHYYRGGLVAFSLAALAVMTVTTGGPPGWTGRLLAARPLRALGLISYGVYLWHWPVIVYLDPTYRDWLPQRPRNAELLGTTVNLTEVGIDVARVAVSLGLALASYKLLEQPIRQRTWEKRIGGLPLLLVGGAVTLAVLIFTLVVTSGSTDGGNGGAPDLNTDRETVYPQDEAVYSDDAPRLLLIGDSGALTTGDGFMDHGREHDVAVAYAADPECTIIYPEGLVLHDSGETEGAGRCHDERWDEITTAVETFRPDTVVYYFANAGMLTYAMDDGFVDDCDAAYMDYLADTLTDELAYFESEGVDVTLMTSPYIGTMDPTSAPRVDCRNEVYSQLEDGPYAPAVVDLNGFISELTDPPEVDNSDYFDDWVHLNDNGAVTVAEWLFPQLYPDR